MQSLRVGLVGVCSRGIREHFCLIFRVDFSTCRSGQQPLGQLVLMQHVKANGCCIKTCVVEDVYFAALCCKLDCTWKLHCCWVIDH